MLFQGRFCSNLRIIDKGKTWSLDFVLLVLANVSQLGFLSRLVLLVLSSLLDRGETGLVPLAKLAINVGSLH